MSEIVVSNVVGLFVGILTSFFSWWVLFHGIVPNIRFSNYISKLPTQDDGTGWKYRFKFVNVGHRALIDIKVVARITIQGLWASQNWQTFLIPLDWNGERDHEIPQVRRGTDRVLRLFLNDITGLKREAAIPASVRMKADSSLVCLEDLLGMGVQAKLVVYVFGSDEFSGARKLYSKSYHLSDIKLGRFKGLEISLEPQAEERASAG